MKILTTGDAEWDRWFQSLPPEYQDVHFTRAYASIQELRHGGRAICAVHNEGSSFVMQPFMVQRIGTTDYFDLTSLYGYGGPIGFPDSAARFQDALWQWARSEYVVSEFCCMHPLYNQAPLLDHVVQTYAAAKPVIVINLPGLGVENLRRNVRRGLKAAEKFGAKVHRDTAPRLFASLYDKSMARLKATDFWHYPLEYWHAHDESVGARFYFEFTPNGVQRGLLVIGLGANAYAHFLGSDGENRHEGLDELLYFEAAKDLRDSGFARLHLGGGLSGGVDDPLLRFKAGFSDTCLAAERYGRVFDAAAYDSFCARRAKEELEAYNRESTAQFFPQYRRPFR